MACSMAGSGADRKIRLPYPSLSHGASRSLTLTNIDGAMSMAIHNGADKTDSKSRRRVVSGLWDFSSMCTRRLRATLESVTSSSRKATRLKRQRPSDAGGDPFAIRFRKAGVRLKRQPSRQAVHMAPPAGMTGSNSASDKTGSLL